MSKRKETTGFGCDKKIAASLAATSILSYFKDKKWKIISFFPNAICVGKECPCKKEKEDEH